MTRVLHASTRRHEEWGGPKRYIRIIVHDTTAEFQKKVKAYNPFMTWSHAAGAFHPAPDRERCDEHGNWVRVTPPHWAGVMRLSAEELCTQMIVHECVHAAANIYRMDIKTVINLGNGCVKREEQLAYIIGDLSETVTNVLRNAKIY